MSGRLHMLTLLFIASSSSAFAHHSFAMFDSTKSQSKQGVIREVQWTNPHVWVRLAVQEDGREVVYSYEAAAVAVLKRVGWQRDSVKAGDRVTVVGHPYKDGRPGGSIDHLVLPDGQTLGTGDAIPGALAVPGVQ
jgi:Family of unknown function (DUF6152)